jgi:hypothetical protein
VVYRRRQASCGVASAAGRAQQQQQQLVCATLQTTFVDAVAALAERKAVTVVLPHVAMQGMCTHVTHVTYHSLQASDTYDHHICGEDRQSGHIGQRGQTERVRQRV